MFGTFKNKKAAYRFQVLIVGDAGVGKSSLIKSLQDREITLNDKKVEMAVWEMNAINDNRVRILSSDTVMVVCDLTNRSSYDHLDAYVKQVKDQIERPIQILLVGTKSDLDSKRQVTKEEFLTHAKALRCECIETSALNNMNVSQAFQLAAASIVNHNEPTKKDKKPMTMREKVKKENSPRVNEVKKYDYESVVVMVGGEQAGKSMLMSRFTHDTYVNPYTPTIGISRGSKLVTEADKTVKLTLFDCAGGQAFQNIIEPYYHRANTLLIVCDLTKNDSIDRLNQEVERARANCREKAQILIVGTKSDDINSNIEKFREKAKELNCRSYETSAKNSYGVDEVFQHAAHDMINQNSIDANQVETLLMVKSSSPVKTFFKNHWKAMLAGALIVTIIALLGIASGGAIPIIASGMAVSLGVSTLAGGGIGFGVIVVVSALMGTLLGAIADIVITLFKGKRADSHAPGSKPTPFGSTLVMGKRVNNDFTVQNTPTVANELGTTMPTPVQASDLSNPTVTPSLRMN